MSIAKKIKEIKKIKVEPGEALLIQYDPTKVSNSDLEMMNNVFNEVFPNNQVVFHSMALKVQPIDATKAKELQK